MDIVEELRKDPENGTRRLESEYKGRLMVLARRLCGDEGDAEELVNSTFAEVVASIDRYEERSAFFAWMARILVHRHGHDTERKSNRTVVLSPEIVDAAADPASATRIADDIDASLLRDAIESLPQEIRNTLLMHYFMDIPVREIARVLSVPTGTIAWRLHYARMLLAAKLGVAAKKPGGKAVLLALALSVTVALGAGVAKAIRAATRADAERADRNAECTMRDAEAPVQNVEDDEPTTGEGAGEAAGGDEPTTGEGTGEAAGGDGPDDSGNPGRPDSSLPTEAPPAAPAPPRVAFAAPPAGAYGVDRPAETPAETRRWIQDAIDEAARQSPAGTVVLGEGVFEIDAQLMVTGGVTLAGQGWTETTLRQTSGADRVATLRDGSRLFGVTATGGRLTAAWQHGAGVYVGDGTVSWCRVWHNRSAAYNNAFGGGVYIESGAIDHSVVASNRIDGLTSGGGGIGAYNAYGTILVDACLVHGNAVAAADGKGGGVCLSIGNPAVTIRNTTIAGNSAGGEGGGLYHANTYGDRVTLVNGIVAGNAAASGADHAGTLAAGSSGNLVGADPLFVDAAGDDYRLAMRSPAVRAGASYGGIGDDLAGAAFHDPPSIGCYEYLGTLLAGAPSFSPASGVTFHPSIRVELSCPTDGATIRYTTDGSDPTEASAPYEEPILLSATTTIKARAFRDGMCPSDVAAATYALGDPAPPAFGAVAVAPRATAAAFSGEIASVGNNLATACDVYLALGAAPGSLGAARRVVSGATGPFAFTVPGLEPETEYAYRLTISNDAAIAQSASTDGRFATTPRQALRPVSGDPAATRARIQEEIDAAAYETPAGTVDLDEGLFEIDAQLMVTGGVAVVGRGWKRTVVRQTASGSEARCATVGGGARLEGVTLTGGHLRGKFVSGAGVLVEDGTVSWCCITNNRTGDAVNSGVTVNNNYGAGVHIRQGVVDHSVIALNTAYANGGSSHGGGIGVYEPTGPVRVETCLVYGNRAPNGKGGGIYAQFINNNRPFAVRNTTIATNEASGRGGGVYVGQSYGEPAFSLANSILADNVSGMEDPNLALPDDAALASGYEAQSFGNLFADGTDALGEGSRSVPGSGAAWFVQPAKGNYRLPAGSPAIGAGAWYEGIPEDLDRAKRRRKPSAGCYETRGGTLLILR